MEQTSRSRFGSAAAFVDKTLRRTAAGFREREIAQ
jgi:hypothetical protein